MFIKFGRFIRCNLYTSWMFYAAGLSMRHLSNFKIRSAPTKNPKSKNFFFPAFQVWWPSHRHQASLLRISFLEKNFTWRELLSEANPSTDADSCLCDKKMHTGHQNMLLADPITNMNMITGSYGIYTMESVLWMPSTLNAHILGKGF